MVALTAGPALGQGAGGEAPQGAQRPPAVDPIDIAGRSFSGLRLPLAPVAGDVAFEANHAWVWVEDDGTGRVQRLLLEGDVRVTLAHSHFDARRAVIWLQRLPGEPGDAPTHQVFAYFDEVGSIGADAGTALQAERLSVDGVVMSPGPVRLAVDLAEQGRPNDAFVREAEREFARYLRELATGETIALEEVPIAEGPPAEPGAAGVAGGYPPPALEEDLLLEPPVVADAGEEIFASEGIITFDPGQIALVTGESGRSLLLTEGVKVLYRDTRSDRTLQMEAQRAVVYLSEGTVADLGQFRTQDVQGLYLEGDVIVTDGKYTLRGPRVFYDVARDRALIVDSVFWTYDQRAGMPLYVRAEALRQESHNQFVAKKATVSNTRFARPHMSIGVNSITVRRYTRTDGTTGNMVDAGGVVLRGGRAPLLPWPRWVGDPQRFPLRDLRVESSSRTGPAWKTTWDFYTLLGRERPEWLDTTELLVDYYNERGFALGTNVGWQNEQAKGGVFAYLLFHDTGEDVMSSGRKIDLDGETRGIVLAENRWRLNSLWTLTTEGAYLSDERLAESLFEELARERRELTTRARLDRTDSNSQLALEAKGNLNDFIANEYLLESRGYSVSKLPELSYVRVADDLAPNLWPGVFTLNSEYRVGRLGLEFHEPTAAELGFPTDRLADLAFGIDPNDSVGDALRARGLDESGVVRADMRHEVSTVLKAGPLRINPFVVGRATAYDTDFEGYSPAEDDNARLWGAAGVRLSTTLQRVDNSVESDLFDLHRVRHIIEPGVTVWHAGSTVDRVDLPVYDDAVESLAEGTIVRVGIDQTWQTKRGGPGRWRSVDVLKLRTEYVWSSGDVDREYPIGHWFEDRPELSSPGEFIDAELLWQVSDPVGIAGRIIYDVEETHQPEYSTLGVIIDHDERLRSSFGQRFVNALDSTLLFYNLNYELTEKYRATAEITYDSTVDDFDRVSFTLRRDYPNITVGIGYSYNFIADEASIGFILSPRGLGGGLGVRTGEERSRIGG
ncbi:MAG TPA: hypothetical protein VFF69_06220 [Phycisphaerales bacterium]|nr:hypothetical protein [Phycisphaerales bacterium]